MPTTVNGEVEVTTTVRTRGRLANNSGQTNHRSTASNVDHVMENPTSASKAQASLSLFKNLKRIQSSLRKDDLSWD